MKKSGQIVSYVAVMLFALLTAFYTKVPEPLSNSSSNLDKRSAVKKYRVCIGIEITREQEGVDYVCIALEGYCTVTVDEADIQFDSQTGNYYVNGEDIIDSTEGEFENL